MSSRRPVAWQIRAVGFAVAVLTVGLLATPAAANSKYASLVIDANTGEDIRARNADSPRYPASLTKIMTLYVLFGEIDAGRIKKSDRIPFSKHAAAQPPSKLGLKPGETITVDNAIRALITKSANDVAAAVGEHISGTEWQFAKRMTATARELGMSKTTFRNASGLPNNEQKTTARDMAQLGLRIMNDFPELYKMFKLKSFTWRGNTYSNHNRLLGKYSGTEGIKTGYIRASGYNLVASVRRGEKVAIGVVMGGKSGSSRNAHMRAILDESFPKLSTRPALPPRPKPALIAAAPERAAPAAPAPEQQRAQKVHTRPGVIRLTMVEVPPRSRELPLAEPISRTPGYSAAGSQRQIRPTAARAAVMRPAPLPPTAMTAYQTASVPEEAASYTGEEEGSVDPIERLIAAAMTAPVVPGDESPASGSVRAGRLIVPEPAAAPPGGGLEAPASVAAADFTPSPEAIEIPAGYQIQVGAYASQSDAQRRLEAAQASANELLAKAMGFTPSVEKKSGTIYRARFAGLDKQSANRACSTLKKRRIDCIVVAQ